MDGFVCFVFSGSMFVPRELAVDENLGFPAMTTQQMVNIQACGIFLAHYLSNNTFVGATPLQYAFIVGLSVSQSLLLSPLITTLKRLTQHVQPSSSVSSSKLAH
jgi:hypothetical protein